MKLKKEITNMSDFYLYKNTLSVGRASKPTAKDNKETTIHYLFRDSTNQIVGGFSTGFAPPPGVNLHFGETLSFWNLFLTFEYTSNYEHFDKIISELKTISVEKKFDSLFTEIPKSECHKYRASGFSVIIVQNQVCYATKRLF